MPTLKTIAAGVAIGSVVAVGGALFLGGAAAASAGLVLGGAVVGAAAAAGLSVLRHKPITVNALLVGATVGALAGIGGIGVVAAGGSLEAAGAMVAFNTAGAELVANVADRAPAPAPSLPDDYNPPQASPQPLTPAEQSAALDHVRLEIQRAANEPSATPGVVGALPR